jgi:hypothetical protein
MNNKLVQSDETSEPGVELFALSTLGESLHSLQAQLDGVAALVWSQQLTVPAVLNASAIAAQLSQVTSRYNSLVCEYDDLDLIEAGDMARLVSIQNQAAALHELVNPLKSELSSIQASAPEGARTQVFVGHKSETRH